MLSNSLIELDRARYAPPLCCSEADIDAIIERTARTLDDTLADAEVRAALQH